MSGIYHTTLNSALAKSLNRAFDGYQLVVCGERKHIDICRKKINTPGVLFQQFYFPKVSFANLFFRDFLACLLSIRYMIKAERKDVLIFSYALPITHYTVVLFNWFLRRNIKIMLHCEMESFVAGSSLGYSRYLYKVQKPLFHLRNNIQYILLGESIYVNIHSLFPDREKVVVIDHPYDYKEERPGPGHRNGADPYNFGIIGRGNKSKNGELIFDLARDTKRLVEKGDISFQIIGETDESILACASDLVSYYRSPLDEPEFTRMIGALDYALFFWGARSYKATASGSLLDAVNFLKPLISLNNDYIKYYFERFGNIGFLCNSIEEMGEKIASIVRDPRAFDAIYDEQVGNLRKMKADMSLASIGVELKNQLIL